MHPLPPELWERGLSYREYRTGVGRNQELFDELYREPSYRAEDLTLLARLPHLRIVAVAEDWCPDVYHTLPTWARATGQLPGWELRVFARDRHAELMDSFLWRGTARRIPVYAFYDPDGRLQVWWSGRSAAAEETLRRLLGGRSFEQLGAEDRQALGRAFDESYRRDLRRRNFEEIVALLKAFFHVQ
jgi:hypothetical protein